LKSFEGLSFVDFIVLPHLEEKNKQQYETVIKEYENKYKIIPLTNYEAVLVEDENIKIIKI